jgi:hypothetical protein
MRRPPRPIRVLAPLCSLAAAACLFFAFELDAPQPLNLGGGQYFIPEPSVAGKPVAIVRSAQPTLLNLGWILLGMSAVFWFWDVATSD